MSVRLCCVSVIGLCYILCILQHFFTVAVFSGHGVYSVVAGVLTVAGPATQYDVTVHCKMRNVSTTAV